MPAFIDPALTLLATTHDGGLFWHDIPLTNNSTAEMISAKGFIKGPGDGTDDDVYICVNLPLQAVPEHLQSSVTAHTKQGGAPLTSKVNDRFVIFKDDEALEEATNALSTATSTAGATAASTAAPTDLSLPPSTLVPPTDASA